MDSQSLERVPCFQASVEADLALRLLDRPCVQSACVAGGNILYPCLELLLISKAHRLSDFLLLLLHYSLCTPFDPN
jgi:hypothetical protein